MDFFPGRHLSPDSYSRLLTEQHARVATGAWSWFILPWNLTMGTQDSYNFCGPVALAFLPMLFLFRLKHSQLRFLAATCIIFLAAGLAITHIFRFILTDFILFYVLLAAVLAGGERPEWGKWASWACGLSAVLCFAYLSAISHHYYDCAGIWTGRQTRAQYLEGSGKITPYYALTRWVSKHVPEGSGLLVAGDSRGLYYDRNFLTNTVFDEQVLCGIARRQEDARGIALKLKQMGVEYLAVNTAEGVRVSNDYHHYDLTSGEWKKLDDFVQRFAQLVYLENGRGLYRLLSSAAERPSSTETLDLLLFFSGPACRYMTDRQKQQWQAAQRDLEEVLQLYPFSAFWKAQKLELDRIPGILPHG